VAKLDAEIDPIDIDYLSSLDAEQWFEFLHDKYFPWKYTARNRLATTRASLCKHRNRENGLADLERIRDHLVQAPTKDTAKSLKIATSIGGLGVAGASGLLSLIYPGDFGTVDEYLILALASIHSLPEHNELADLKKRIERSKAKNTSFAISERAGVMLIAIMRRKSEENNNHFSSSDWTPRRIDKVLWAWGHL